MRMCDVPSMSHSCGLARTLYIVFVYRYLPYPRGYDVLITSSA